MFNIGDYVIYKHEVCIIKEIKKGRNDKDYYTLRPIDDDTLKIELPVDFANKSIKELITKKKALELIKNIPNIEVIKIDTKLLDDVYKNLLSENTHESLIRIIKTTYLRNKERIENKRKTSDKDEYYFNLAEKYLYNELSIALDKTFDETKEYIIKELEK